MGIAHKASRKENVSKRNIKNQSLKEAGFVFLKSLTFLNIYDKV
jgi:hypothetical protein